MNATAMEPPLMFSTRSQGTSVHPLADIFLSPDLRRLLPGLALASLLYNLIALALPMAILQIIDRVLANQSVETLVFLVAGVLVCLALEEFLRAVNILVTGWLGARFEHAASLSALHRILRVPQRVLKRDEPGVHAERIAAAGRVAEFYSGQALLVVFDLPFVAIFVAMIYIVGGWVVIVPLALLAIFAGVIWLFGTWVRTLVGRRSVHEERRFNFLREVFSGIHSVKALAMEAQIERRHDRLLATSAQVNESLSYGNAMASSTGMLFSQVMVVGVVFAGAWAVLSREMTPGGLAACMMLSVRALQPLRRSFSIWLRYQSFLTAHAKLREVTLMPWEEDAGKPPMPPVRESLELREVSLGQGAGAPFFRGLSLTLKAGECVALRGGSGSGKSTLLTLMNGLERPEAGTVLVDGRDLAGFSVDSVQRGIALLPQSGIIFTGTVLENLTMFDPQVREHALDLARQLGLDAVVGQMRLGYQTPLGEGNIETLPAGVRQMISIVRALAHDPSVILFDEANISLDMEGDRLVRDYLASRKGQCIIVLVTHRPSLLSLAERTLVVSNGAIVDGAAASERESPAGVTGGAGSALPPKPPPADDLSDLVRLHFLEETDLERCLVPMLRSLRWDGSPRELAEAMPQMVNDVDLTGYCSVMANLGFHPRQVSGRLDRLDERLLPCLFVPRDRPALVVLSLVPDGKLRCFDPSTQLESDFAPDAVYGEVFVFRPPEASAPGAGSASGFFSALTLRFRPHVVLIFLLTGCSTVIALVPPLFVKSIYDQILPNGDIIMQAYLFMGVSIVLALDFQLRKLKGRAMAFVAGRAEFIVGTAIFNRVLSLPASATESVSVNRQVGRMRSFESLRDFFLGPLSVMAFDLPACLVLLAAIAYFSPLALYAVLGGGAAFVALALATRGTSERRVSASGRAMALRREFLDEAMVQVGTVRSTGARATWVERFRQLCGKAVTSSYQDQQYQARVNGVAQVLGTATGLVALALSAYAAIQGEITGGAMIATMMIVWRLTGPLQNFFLAAASFVKIRTSVQQVENLMRLPSESTGRTRIGARRATQGSVSFTRVSFRYASDADPALLGISVSINPGQVIVITGPNGSGKSTLLKLMTRAFSPQAGTIRFDGLDIRQLTAADLRSRISYMPQNCDLFYGTVGQNLRLVHPAASPEELAWAAEMAGMLEEVRALPQGFETRISNNHSDQLPNGFRQRLSLARMVLKPAALVILDEPGTGLDKAGEEALQRCMKWLRGRSTMVIVSHRPAHMRHADSVLYMERGSIVAAGPFDTIKDRLMAGIRR